MKDYSFNQLLIGLGIFILFILWRNKRIKKRKVAIQNAKNQMPTIIKELSLGLEMMPNTKDKIITQDFLILYNEASEQIENTDKLFSDVCKSLNRPVDYALGIGKQNMIKITDIFEKIVTNLENYTLLLKNEEVESLSQEKKELYTKIFVMFQLNILTLSILKLKLYNTFNYLSYSEIPMYKWMNTFPNGIEETWNIVKFSTKIYYLYKVVDFFNIKNLDLNIKI